MSDLVQRSINESVQYTRIVTIDEIDMRQAAVRVEYVCETLYAECEGDVEANGLHEYWGTTVDGDEWRVHVEVSS